MKKSLQHNINRIDLLTDSKIGEVKGILKQLADNIITLSKRVTHAENEMLKKEYESLPVDVLALTKDEFQLRQDLAKMVLEARETRDFLQKEFKRLRREHYSNLKDIEQILLSFDQMSHKVQGVLERQSMNDNAMASIFKIIKLDNALDSQDEKDRLSLNLMGLTNTGIDVDGALRELQKGADIDAPLDDTAAITAINNTPATEVMHTQETANSGKSKQSVYSTSGKFVKQVKASTKVPVEHKLKDENHNKARPVKVVSLDTNCQTCADATHNELTMKAFKMACLQYTPSPVFFENSHYMRKTLIQAKDTLLRYCLAQLKHLDLGII